MPRIFLCSATGSLTTDAAPVGGGVAVLEALIPHLEHSDFEVTLLTPGATESRDGIRQQLPVPTLERVEPDRILRLNARRYADFAFEWESALSSYFADIDTNETVVLANDTRRRPALCRVASRTGSPSSHCCT